QTVGLLGDKPFRRLLQPENLSREELVDVLREAVVDQKGPLVTLNKPQGLPVTGKPGELTLVSVLPELSQCLGLGERELQVVRASGKETSGLVLLSSCPQTASRLQKFFTHSQRARKPTATYCAVTDGIPAASEGKIQAALKMEHTDGASLRSPASYRCTWSYSSALCSGTTSTLPVWAQSWASAFCCQLRTRSPKDRYPSPPACCLLGVGLGWGWTASPDISYAAWASRATCSPVLLYGPEQITAPPRPPHLGSHSAHLFSVEVGLAGF
uniref:Pseudouridine synthase RsuA/RluA-like domain-containing protein n=1 Tax=Sus scrofa TaxID=9823 RepID=A0A4X1USR5_PIG